ncbi:MAG: HAD-IIIA family hydrolase [Bacteroidota bacterium]|nr:HAD-IIIA family hydrolase [Bacteroidota bacterium]MDX5426646.1 HAD-IIIA family hydrolase [Bacteroidota bacterium]MDX5447063.1 HAD-IIIA family hydrolase [Bacteroidota bacterium]MDX5504654.1 HAD-IIIA family hydrolase [Bacteroidota bacterium]
MKKNYKELLNHITTFIFDVDGVLTDGSVLLVPGEEPIRKFNSKDGFALQLAMKKGYRVAIITGGKSLGVKERLQAAGVMDIYMGASDKIEALRELQSIYDLKVEETLFMGDDLPDYEVMEAVGVATCPADAVPEIRAISDYVSPKKGGHGCVRDVIEQTLKVQNNWMKPGDHVW